MDETPIFDFQGFKNLLTQKGYHIGKAEPWRNIDSEEVSLREGNIEFSDDGIFLVDDDGLKRQVFLYKRRYKLMQYGKPRFHICKCKTIESFLKGTDIPEYRRANTKSVKVLDRDNNDEETEVSDLPLCKYCAALQCLCIKCHSEVNSEHIRNFSTKNLQLLIRLFLEKYGKNI